MKELLIMAVFVFALGAHPLGADEKVVIGGSGSLIEDMQELAKAYAAKNPSDAIQVLSGSMSNTGGIEGVKMGRLSIGLVTDEPKGADKEKLTYRVVERTPAAVAVNKALAVTSLTEAQVCDIFSGKLKSWKEVGGTDAKIMVLTRKKDDANTDTVREKMACFKDLKITPEAIVLIRGSEVLDSLDKRSSAVGIVNVGTSLAERANVKPLAIEGVAPTVEAVQNGKYKFYNERGVVTLGPPKPTAKRFLDFIASAEGQRILASRGVIPVK